MCIATMKQNRKWYLATYIKRSTRGAMQKRPAGVRRTKITTKNKKMRKITTRGPDVYRTGRYPPECLTGGINISQEISVRSQKIVAYEIVSPVETPQDSIINEQNSVEKQLAMRDHDSSIIPSPPAPPSSLHSRLLSVRRFTPPTREAHRPSIGVRNVKARWLLMTPIA